MTSARMGIVPEITLNDGMITFVDDEDVDLAQLGWYARTDKGGRIAVARTINRKDALYNQWMHRVILERKLGRALVASELSDHIDSNALNNRRENLRVATYAQNSANRKRNAKHSTGFKGVLRNGYKNPERAFRATCAGVVLGYYPTAEEAHAAYCKAARERWGEFANFGDTPKDAKEVG